MTNLYAKFVRPTAGYDSDVEKAKALTLDTFYKVTSIDMGSSHTEIILEDQGKTYWNSVHFEFYKEVDGSKIRHDIFSDPKYNPYL